MFSMAGMRSIRSLAIAAPLAYLRYLDLFEKRSRMAKIVTANTLATGHVVYLAADGGWVEAVAQAFVYDDAAAAEHGLDSARRDVARGLIVEPFLTEKGPDIDGRPAMTLRDSIRAFGPTIAYLPQDAQVSEARASGQG